MTTIGAFLVTLLALAATVAADTAVRVTVMYPQANLDPSDIMNLRGSLPLSWDSSLPMQNTRQNTWEATFTVSSDYLNASTPEWEVDLKTIINDDAWQIGANDRVTLTYNPSTSYMVINVTIYPYYQTYNGTQETIRAVYSPQLNNSRDVWVYVPPGSVENSLRVERNVLVMHDGQNLAPLWNVPEILDDLIVAGKMDSVFIVGPYNTGLNRLPEYTYCPDPNFGGGEGDLYLDFIEKTLLPLIRMRYRVLTNKENLGTLGSSLGGLISCYAGVTRPHVYSKIGCMSSSFWWDYGNFSAFVMPKVTRLNVETQKYYIDSGDSGDSDDDRTDTSMVASQFVQKGFTLGQNFFWYLQRGGQHNEYFWSLRLHHPMQWLYFRDALMNGDQSG